MAYRDRIFAAPYITLADVDAAVAELEWAIDQDARAVVLRAAAPVTSSGPRSPAADEFDPFWARANEAGITVVVHAGDAGLSSNGYAAVAASRRRSGAARPGRASRCGPLSGRRTTGWRRSSSRSSSSASPTCASASVENGSDFLAPLFRKLRTTARRMPGYFAEDPVDTFRRHIWINPFWEDDVDEVVDLMGDDRVIFGSDWPHVEGLRQPTDWVSELQKLPAESVPEDHGRATWPS